VAHEARASLGFAGLPKRKFADTQFYTCVKRGTARVKCLAQEHNMISPAGA